MWSKSPKQWPVAEEARRVHGWRTSGRANGPDPGTRRPRRMDTSYYGRQSGSIASVTPGTLVKPEPSALTM